MKIPWLSLLTFLPLAGGIFTLTARRRARFVALLFAAAAILFVVTLWFLFAPRGGMQFEERWSWLPSLHVDYHLGIDGLSLPMLALSALVVAFAIVASWAATPLYLALLLFVEAGLFGVFTALNFFHWFLFWELSLVPAFFLVRFGGRPEQTRAALQFFLYTMFGSVAMLLAFLSLYRRAGTFDFLELVGRGSGAGFWIFAGVLLGLIVKVPMVPFHTWLPSTYAEAPASTSMVLTGALSKMGLYGLLRLLMPIFPAQIHAWQTPLLWLAVATVLFPAAAAFVQADLKRVVAYSSINHLGYCLLGVFAALSVGTDGQVAALNGVVLQMFNHGITAASLFYFVGLIENRGGARGLSDFGGLRRAAPLFAGLMGIAVFASVGLPGLNGFVGEFLIFKGVFALAAWAAVAAVPGLFLTALFFLTLWRQVWHGPLPQRWDGWPDLTPRERWTSGAAVFAMFALGVFPQVITGVANPAVMQLITRLTF